MCKLGSQLPTFELEVLLLVYSIRQEWHGRMYMIEYTGLGFLVHVPSQPKVKDQRVVKVFAQKEKRRQRKSTTNVSKHLKREKVKIS